jgi:hypothetical protein
MGFSEHLETDADEMLIFSVCLPVRRLLWLCSALICTEEEFLIRNLRWALGVKEPVQTPGSPAEGIVQLTP